MTPPQRDHEAFDELAVGWALHALEPEDEAAFVRHLPDCPRCSRTVAETEEVMGAMAADLPPAEPSEGLRARLRAAVQQTEQVRRPAAPAQTGPPPAAGRHREPDTDPALRLPFPADPQSPRPAGRAPARQRALLFTLAAAVAGVVGLGVWNVTLSSDRDRAVEVAAEQSAVVEELLRPGARVMAQLSDSDGRPLATVVTRDGDLQVVSQGLAVNDDTAQTYVLWGVAGGVADGVPVPLGTFDVDRSGLDVDAVVSPPTGAGSFAQYAVSLEPGRQPPPEPSGVLASGQVTS
jgi:anti-sigma-K factor RskA